MDAVPSPAPAAKRESTTLLSSSADIETQLRAEIDAMLRHAFSTGIEVPPQVMDAAQQAALSSPPPLVEQQQQRGRVAPLAKLAALHAQLAKVVAPAMPGTLHLLRIDSARSGTIHALLGPLSNVRRLMAAALMFMLSFMLISLSPSIDHAAMARDIYTMDGLALLTVLCFLLSAAGMGGTFQALFTAHVYVSNATYDPRYDASYWIRIGLGLVAGLLLSVLVPINSSVDAPTVAKPVMALLGGFSAGLVYRILQRLVETVESLFQGDRDAMRRREGDLTRAGAQQAVTEARMDFASQLVGLRDEMAQGASQQRLNESLSTVLDGLLQRRGDTVAAPAARAGAGVG